MPTVQISVYLTDEEYGKYVPVKEELNETARSSFKEALSKVIKNE